MYLALCAGRAPSAVADFLDLPRSLVYRIKQAYDNFDGPEEEKEAFCVDRKIKEAHRSVRDSTFVANMKMMVEANPRKSIRAIAREMGVSNCTVRLAIHEDLRLKSYALRKAQLLTEAQAEKRFIGASALLNDMKHETAGYLCFFSDGKIFTQEQNINSRNDRYLSDDIGKMLL